MSAVNRPTKKRAKRNIRSKQEILKEKFIEELSKNPIKEAVCHKLNIPRANIYRWMQEDSEFKQDVIDATMRGNDIVNDIAKNKMIEKIKNGDSGMIKYHLSRRHPEYVDPIYNMKVDDGKIKELSEERKAAIAKRIENWMHIDDDEDDEEDEK